MTYLLDTDWAIEAIGGNVDVLNQLQTLAGGRISLSWVTIAELYDGAYWSIFPSEQIKRIQAFRIYLRSANRWYLRNQMSPQASLSSPR